MEEKKTEEPTKVSAQGTVEEVLEMHQKALQKLFVAMNNIHVDLDRVKTQNKKIRKQLDKAAKAKALETS